MQRTFLITLLLLLFGYYGQSQSSKSATWDGGSLTEAQRDSVLQYTEAFPFASELSIALLDGDSVKLVGVRKTKQGLRTVSNTDQFFEIGSVTKVFTAGILAQFVIDKKLSLDNPVADLLPVEMKQPKLEGATMTLRHLANHTSGLLRMPSNFSPTDMADPYADYDEKALHTYLQDQQTLATPPGTQYAYSNLGFGLLGHLLTQQARTDYATLLKQYITEPLDMSHTFVAVPRAWQASRVPGRDPFGNPTANWNLGAFAGAGAIKSTASDLVIWVQANMNDTAPTHALWKLCQTPTFKVSEDVSLGLGWHIVKKDGREVYFHNGGTGGYTSYVAFDPVSKTGAVVLSNVSAFSPQMGKIDQLGFVLLSSLR